MPNIQKTEPLDLLETAGKIPKTREKRLGPQPSTISKIRPVIAQLAFCHDRLRRDLTVTARAISEAAGSRGATSSNVARSGRRVSFKRAAFDLAASHIIARIISRAVFSAGRSTIRPMG
jgi:hypothetical protein